MKIENIDKKMNENRINAAIIGFGYWGKIIAKKILTQNIFSIKYICDISEIYMNGNEDGLFSHIVFTSNLNQVLSDQEVKAVFVIVPPEKHFDIAKLSLEYDKHVWLEKPCSTNFRHFDFLVKKSLYSNRVLHLDFTYIYNPFIRKIKDKLKEGSYFKVRFSSRRLNNSHIGAGDVTPLGLFQDLGVHDLSILSYLFQDLNANLFEYTLSDNDHNKIYKIKSLQKNLKIEIDISWNYGKKVRDLEILTNEQLFRLSLDEKGRECLFYKDSKVEGKVNHEEGNDAIENSLQAFANKIRTRIEPVIDIPIGYFYHDVLKKIKSEWITEDEK